MNEFLLALINGILIVREWYFDFTRLVDLI